jgi:hypothetical protein
MNIQSKTIACPLLLAAALTGCANLLPDSDIKVISYKQSGERWLNASFYIIEHPFTEDGTTRAKARANQLCGESQRVAVQSERGCTLEKCTTNFVCMKQEDAKSSGL